MKIPTVHVDSEPRTYTTKHGTEAVMTLLEDAEWGKWSDREIARQCNVSDMLVADVRREHLQVLADGNREAVRTVERSEKKPATSP